MVYWLIWYGIIGQMKISLHYFILRYTKCVFPQIEQAICKFVNEVIIISLGKNENFKKDDYFMCCLPYKNKIKNFKMINTNHEAIKNFLLQSQTVASIFHCYLSKVSGKRIIFNTNCLASEHIILFEEERTTSCISVEEFISILANRWNEELNYKEEIVLLKGEIYDFFLNLFPKNSNNNVIALMRDQASEITNEMLILLHYDKKMKVDKFCTNILNGFESEVENDILEIFCYVLINSYLKPIPKKLLFFIKKTFCFNDLHQNKIIFQQKTAHIIQYLQKYLKPMHVNSSDWSEIELQNLLNKLYYKRQICVISIKDFTYANTLIREFQNKCIDSVEIVTNSNTFLLNASKYQLNFHSLKLIDSILPHRIIKILNAAPKNMKSLTIEYCSIETEDENMFTVLSGLVFMKYLNLNFQSNNFLFNFLNARTKQIMSNQRQRNAVSVQVNICNEKAQKFAIKIVVNIVMFMKINYSKVKIKLKIMESNTFQMLLQLRIN